MQDKDAFRKLFSRNLNRFLSANGMTQLELSRRMSVSTATVSEWCTGKKIPRMDKVDKLCEIFGINRSNLIEDTPSQNIVPISVQELARELYDNPPEQNLLKKYRVLDEYGKKNVDTILDNEYDRCTQQAVPEPSPLSFQDSELRAAHNDNTDPDQLEKMKRDFERLEKLKKERESHKG